MSTVLINTNGKSQFQEGTSIANFGVDDTALKKLGIELTDVDKRPILAPTRKVIDVVNDFSWYAGPKATPAALNRIPCCFLTEREQLLSSLVSGSIYYLNAGGQFAKNTLNGKFVQSLLGKASDGSKEAGVVSAIQTTVNTAIDTFNLIAGSEEDRGLLDRHNLKSLEGIYFTKPTGFNYRLPLYESPQTRLSQGFSENAAGQIGELASRVIDKVTDISEILAKGVNFAQPGVYIEKPQYFQGAGYRTETIKFPLSNTVRRGAVSPIQQNYEFLWLLAFQNRPYKTTFARTPPPKIYTVSVPGQFSMPYAFISDMSVEFVGTTRRTTVHVPSGNGQGSIKSKPIKTNVPEAYQVSITFTSLIGEYGNTMVSDAFSTSVEGERVSVGDVPVRSAPKAEVINPEPNRRIDATIRPEDLQFNNVESGF